MIPETNFFVHSSSTYYSRDALTRGHGVWMRKYAVKDEKDVGLVIYLWIQQRSFMDHQ
jgi:hypothetical protein